MPVDKSLFFYGGAYHRFLDPQLAEGRRIAADLVPDGSRVLDIACGTGQLCFALRADKGCSVVGVDLSLRMLRFAEKRNRFEDVRFVHHDATDLVGFESSSFDFATMLLLFHELPREMQVRALNEALRVARYVIIMDARAPLPRNLEGLGVRLVEATIGRDHYSHFKGFLARGGVMSILRDSGLPITVSHQSVFWHGCREVVVASMQR